MANSTQAQDNQLIYIGDPMCSWCYGFSPELDDVKAAVPDLEFKLVMGGLRPFGEQTMGELHDFLKEHWEEINKRTGQPFAYDIMEDKAFIYDTEPAARAVVTFRQFLPAQELAYFQAVQDAFYAKNKNTHDLQTYLDLLKPYDVDAKAFSEAFESEAMKKATLADFQMSQDLGIRGFPSMVLKKGEEYILVSNGYQKAEGLVRNINRALKK